MARFSRGELHTALLTGLLFGMIRSIKYAGPRTVAALRGGGRTSSQTRKRHRANNALVVVQVALAFVLLIGSGLMIRTFQMLRHVDPGFDPKDAVTMDITIPGALVKDSDAVMRLEQGILEKISAISEVTSAGITTSVPMTGSHGSYQVYAHDKIYRSVPPLRRLKFISPGLLASMRNRLIAGREFTWTDIYQRRPVAKICHASCGVTCVWQSASSRSNASSTETVPQLAPRIGNQALLTKHRKCQTVPSMNARFLEDMLQVNLHGSGADAKFRGDLAVLHPLLYQLHHLLLAGRQFAPWRSDRLKPIAKNRVLHPCSAVRGRADARKQRFQVGRSLNDAASAPLQVAQSFCFV